MCRIPTTTLPERIQLVTKVHVSKKFENSLVTEGAETLTPFAQSQESVMVQERSLIQRNDNFRTTCLLMRGREVKKKKEN